MKKTDSELFSQELTFPKSSRIDVIGQNGNTGCHYKSTKYAIQSIFQYGWDYIGYDDEDGLRQVFKTKKVAQVELDDILELTGDTPNDWRIVLYNPHEDDTFARF